MTTAVATPPKKPLTRLRLRSAPMILLAAVLAALVTFGPPTLLMVHFARPPSARTLHLFLVGLAGVDVVAAGVQFLSFVPGMWMLHHGRLATSGRRWFALGGLAAGSLAAAGIVIAALAQRAASPVEWTIVLLVCCGALGLLGALGGAVFSLTATRRVPLEAVFE